MFKIIKKKNGDEVACLDPELKREQMKKKYEYFLKRSGIPPFYWDIEFKDYKGKNSGENLKNVIQYAKEFHTKDFEFCHLYLSGGNNTQKTSLLCNIGKEAIRQGYTVKFILASSLIDRLMKLQGFSNDKDIAYEIKEIKKSDIILIDDIFDKTKSVYWSNPDSNSLIITAWDSFLRELVSSTTKIVMTSNINVDMIKDKFGLSMYNLIDRNFIPLVFFDDVKLVKKKKWENIFK